MTRLAAAAYPLDWFDGWQGVEHKITSWVRDAAAQGAELLLFPEYAAMELASLRGVAVAGSLARSIDAVSALLPRLDALFRRLATAHGVCICAGSGPVRLADGRVVNRARLIAPSGEIGVQDKLIMTRFERETWRIDPGQALSLFETPLGRIGIVICYDAEFPLIARALIEAGAEILLVPSATEALAGYWRVRIAAMARALEGQCVVAQAPLVGSAAWSPAVDVSRGAAAIYGPPDVGFPETGVLAEGALDAPGWVVADVDRAAIARVRRDGQVLNRAHWPEQDGRLARVEAVALAF